MSGDLDAFIVSNGALPWAWGSIDCALVLADWAIACGHPDPAADWRGIYSDELGWKRIVVRRGGLLPLVNDICSRAGFIVASAPARGVISVIGSTYNIERQWGAIYDGTDWLVRRAEGFVAVDEPFLGMWAL